MIRTSVLNQWSQAHDVANLFVTDGAQMSSAPARTLADLYGLDRARGRCGRIMLREGKI
jgi:choline dehydrogenase-like flavoprotein